jgi:hypothetical protein
MMQALRQRIAEQQQGGRYTEYQESLERTVDGFLSSAERDETKRATLREKIANSRDIRDIVKRRLLSYLSFDNDLIALGMTIGAFYLENRYSDTVKPSSVPAVSSVVDSSLGV